jgi:acyl-CoA synthetase (AMP-forming)/AMP-acid ligase II
MSNNQDDTCCRGSGWSYTLALLGALLIVGALVWAMKHYTTPADLTATRAAERAKNLVDLRAAEKQAMENYGWVDQPKGIVRLTVDRAMELTIADWQNPAQARADLIQREEKATFVPPPPPAKPSPFE